MSLSIQEVSKRFGTKTVVDRLSLSVGRGQMFGLLGANGAGKTTTFRMILGLMKPSEGSIRWSGKTLDYSNCDVVGYLPEERGLYPKLTAEKQIVLLGRLRGMKRRDVLQEMHKWLEYFGIPEYANKKIEELSKGNQQKIQFIAAVIHRPELIILDEPFSGLDPVNVEILKQAVLQLKEKGATILFSSHRMEHVEELCEKLCILDHGRPVVLGELQKIKRQYRKKHVVIEADFDLGFLQGIPGVVSLKQRTSGARIQVEDEAVAKRLFHEVAKKGFVRKFVVEEPTLNDIFIEKVGNKDA